MDKKIITNISFLTVFQLSVYIFPLIITPIVSRALEPIEYGAYLFFISITNYAYLLVEWGYQFYGPRRFSTQNKNEHIKTFIDICFSRISLGFIFFGAVLLANIFLKLNLFELVMVFLIIVSMAINPLIIFHGVEKIYLPSTINFAIRVLSLPIIIFFVSKPSDYDLVILVFSSTFIFGSIVSLIVLFKRLEYELPRKIHLKMDAILYETKRSAKIFFSNATVVIYVNAGVFFLAILSDFKSAAIFGSAMMIIQLSKSITNPITQTIFPRVSKMHNENDSKLHMFSYQFFYLQLGIGILASTSIFFLSTPLIMFFFGEDYFESIYVLKLLSPIPFLVSISNFFGVQGLLARGRDNEFLLITFLGLILTVPVMIYLIPIYNYMAATYAILIAEFIVSILCVFRGFKLIANP